MTPFDRAEAAWESSWIDGPDFEREDDLDPYPNPNQTPASAGEENDDGIPF